MIFKFEDGFGGKFKFHVDKVITIENMFRTPERSVFMLQSGNHLVSTKEIVSVLKTRDLLQLHVTAYIDGDQSDGFWIIDSLRYEKSVGMYLFVINAIEN